jgi:HTH-type transcriptional regulator/antitoxin HigA
MTKLTQQKSEKTMTIKPIKTKKDYQAALGRLEEIFDTKPGTPQGDELEVLGILIDKYEQEHYPIGYPDPIEAIKFRMEQLGYTQNDLAKVVGLKSRASEILNRRRKLTLEMIRQLHQALGIPTDVLIQSY